MAYVVGISSGAFGVAATEERPQLLGLFKKAQYSVTQGVRFVQIDLESVSEFEEPGLEEKMKKDVIEKLGISFGIHSETKAFGVEAAELDSAIREEYERAHRRFIEILEKSIKIGSKYLLFHSSESDPFTLLALRTQPADIVDFYGRPFSEFLKENEWLLDWIMGEGEWKDKEGGQFIWVEILHRTLKNYLALIMEEKKERYIMEEKKEPSEEWLEEVIKRERKSLREYFVDLVSSRALHYGPERWAYYLIAKWMEKNKEKEPLWEKIVRTNIEFFAKRDGMSLEEWAEKNKINLQNLSIDDKFFREHTELWVPAVSAKYIWGHLNPIDPKFKDPKKYIENSGIVLVLESPMGGRGIEEWLRFYNPAHIYHLAEIVGKKYIQIALDLEHMLSLRLDPEIVIDLFPKNGGEYVKVIHAGWPSTLAPAHVPIPLGSEQQQYLYKIYYKLREKGFGLDPKEDVYIIFERGPFPIQQTIVALKKIVEFLEKNIKPEDLIKYPEFFGIEMKEIASFERQKAIISEHFFDPLKDLLAVPEEKWSFLGKEAMGKPGVTGEKWEKEELK
ncbi:MAG: hypothetical protein QXX38_00555 [Candidatus Aenigmatarchaeota archaeon]